MSALYELNKMDGKSFPKGKIQLIDGRYVDCFPLATDELDLVADDTLGIDTTGQHRKSRKDQTTVSQKDKEEDKERFLKNAFYLLANKERILTDSRMFLCPIPIQSGMSLSGTSGFKNPTLGVYLQWWEACPGAMRTDKNGRRSLVYHLAGSNLSGANHCSEVYEDGKTGIVHLYPFREHWQPFVRINNAYTEAKQRYQAYTLKQVLEILDHEEENDREYAITLNEQFHTSEINALNMRLHYLNEQNKALREKYNDAMLGWKEEKIVNYYKGYLDLKKLLDSEMEALAQQKRDLKAALHRGEYTNKEYESLVLPINERIEEAKVELNNYKYHEIEKVFPDENICFWMIEEEYKKIKDREQEDD